MIKKYPSGLISREYFRSRLLDTRSTGQFFLGRVAMCEGINSELSHCPWLLPGYTAGWVHGELTSPCTLTPALGSDGSSSVLLLFPRETCVWEERRYHCLQHRASNFGRTVPQHASYFLPTIFKIPNFSLCPGSEEKKDKMLMI